MPYLFLMWPRSRKHQHDEPSNLFLWCSGSSHPDACLCDQTEKLKLRHLTWLKTPLDFIF